MNLDDLKGYFKQQHDRLDLGAQDPKYFYFERTKLPDSPEGFKSFHNEIKSVGIDELYILLNDNLEYSDTPVFKSSVGMPRFDKKVV